MLCQPESYTLFVASRVTTAPDMATYQDVLRRLAKKPGMNQTKLAALMGLKRQSMTKLLSNKPDAQKSLPLQRLQRLAQRFPEEAVEILSLPTEADDAPKAKEQGGAMASVIEEEVDFDTIPIVSFESGQDGIAIRKVDGSKPRPPILRAVRHAYAFYMPDDTMEPRYRKGWLLWVNPGKPVLDGRDAVVYPKAGGIPVVREIKRDRGKRVAAPLATKSARSLAEADIDHMHLVVGTDQEG